MKIKLEHACENCNGLARALERDRKMLAELKLLVSKMEAKMNALWALVRRGYSLAECVSEAREGAKIATLARLFILDVRKEEERK